jgi:hypothetical protein
VTEATVRARFEMTRVVSRTFSAIGRNWLYFLALAGLTSTVTVVFLWVVDPLKIFASSQTILVWLGITIVSSLLVSFKATAVSYSSGTDDSTLASSLSVAFRRMLPVLGLSWLTALGIGFSAIALLVPAFILATRWAVAVPVLVLERKGITESMARSAELTKGLRWQVFGLILIYLLVSGVASYVIPAVAGGQAQLHTNLPVLIVYALVEAILPVIATAGCTAIFEELRRIKEGGSARQLAEVFG